VSELVPPEPGRSYPVCTGGRRAGPPEDCGDAWAFLDLQLHSLPIVAARAADLLLQLLDAADDVDGDDALDGIAACRRELAELQRWLTIDRFDRRAVNRRIESAGQQAKGVLHVAVALEASGDRGRRRGGGPGRDCAQAAGRRRPSPAELLTSGPGGRGVRRPR
jgi:hypothetical protein